jgi:hypothetical protein
MKIAPERCDRFEREGLLAAARGESLDPHFAACPACVDARLRYARLTRALAASPPPSAAPPPGWERRVLDAAARSEALAARERDEAFPLRAVAAAAAAVALLMAISQRGEAPPPTVEPCRDAAPLPRGLDAPSPPPSSAPARPATLRRSIAPPRSPAPAALDASDDGGAAPLPDHAERAPGAPPVLVFPTSIEGCAPVFPPGAAEAWLEGTVQIRCTLRADGTNTDCAIVKPLPPLDAPILRALNGCRTRPVTADGVPIDGVSHVWQFDLGPPRAAPAPARPAARSRPDLPTPPLVVR